MNAPQSILAPTTNPEGIAEFSANMVAPQAPGIYHSAWQMCTGFCSSDSVFFGQTVTVQIVVPGSSPPPTSSDIEVISVVYPNVVAPGQKFQPQVTVKPIGIQLLESRGDLLRNSNGNLYGAWPHVAVVGTVNSGQNYTYTFYQNDPITAPNGEGTYESKWRVWANGSWVGPEINIRFDVRNGGGTRPNSPTNLQPADWYVSRDGSAPNLCVGAQAGVQYYFEIFESAQTPNSGWISSNCWTPPGLGWYGYQWHAKVRSNGLESNWSETRRFSIDSQQLSMKDFRFNPSSPSTSDEVNVYTCVEGFGGIGNGLLMYANTAPDGSTSGSWYWIDPKGTFCYDPAKPNEWPQWHTRALSDGTHLIRAIGFHGNKENGTYQEVVKETTFTLQRRRPSNVERINPIQDIFLNSRTVTFRWNPEESLRINSFQFHVSTNSDPTVNPVVTQTFGASVREFSFTFDQDYPSLYWGIQACNELGCGDRAIGHFGIDRTVPASAVNALNATTFETVYQVGWGGTDNTSRIRWYDVQYRDGERGDWTDWQTNVSGNVAIFSGQSGHKYFFRARALDNAGNQEQYPSGNGDTATTINPAAAPQVPWWNQGYTQRRNILVSNNDPDQMAAGYPVHLRFDSGTNPTAAEMYAGSQSGNKGDDFRVVYNNTTELSRWVQNFSTSRIDIWFKTNADIGGNSSSGTAYQLYYKNPGASNPLADIDNVMPPGKDANTIGLWHFMEGAGSSFNDTSGHGHNGSLNNTFSWGEDALGPYIQFPGGGNGAGWGEAGASSEFNLNVMTMEAWAYADEGIGNEVSVFYRPKSSPDNCPGYALRRTDSAIDFQLNCAGGRNIQGPIATNQWWHLAATYDGSAMRIYRNGNLIRTVNYGNGVDSTSGRSLYFGGAPFTGTWKGRIRHARLSNIARTDFSYAANYAAIDNLPSLAVGSLIPAPITGTSDLVVANLTTYPDSASGGWIIQADILNQGTKSTQNGFYIDLYANHQPTGAGDYSNIGRFWVSSPIEANSMINVTTLLTDASGVMSSKATKGKKNRQESASAETAATLYVQADSVGVVVEPNKTNNISAGVEICSTTADTFENDGTKATAKVITVNANAQSHNFHIAGDQDWVKFSAQAGKKYTLQTLNLGASADTSLFLYDTNGATLLGANDDADGTLASKIEWTAPSNGTYYLLAKHWNPNVGGCGTTYDLKVRVTDAITPTPTPTPTYTLTPGTPTVETPTPTATPNPGGKPTLLKPKNGAVLKKAKANLDWNDVASSASYNLVVRIESKKGPKKLETSVAVSTAEIKGLKKGKIYYWRVQACDAANQCGKWSKWWNFKRQ